VSIYVVAFIFPTDGILTQSLQSNTFVWVLDVRLWLFFEEAQRTLCVSFHWKDSFVTSS
jgi:hypothetical protein